MRKVGSQLLGVTMDSGLLVAKIIPLNKWQQEECFGLNQMNSYWYFKRFATYRISVQSVHKWLADKPLITQNIDTLDFKAGNKEYIPIHGRLDRVTKFTEEEQAFRINRSALAIDK